MKINIGTIYITKGKKIEEGKYEFALIGIINPKKYQITKYHATISQEILQSKGNEANNNSKGTKHDEHQQGDAVVAIKPGYAYLLQSMKTIVAHKSQSKEYTLNSKINITDISSQECLIGNNQDLLNAINSSGFLEEDLIQITQLEPQYIKSALQIIGKEAIEKKSSNEFITLADAITLALTGLLSPENMEHPYVSLFDIDRGPYVNPAIFLSASADYFCLEEDFTPLSDIWELQKKYIEVLEKIFNSCKIDHTSIPLPYYGRGWEGENDIKSIGWRNELARRTILIYEYLFSLTPEEITQFCNNIAEFYTKLYAFCNEKAVDGGLRNEQFLPAKENLPKIINDYNQSLPKVIAYGNIIKFSFGNGKEKTYELQMDSSNCLTRIAIALKHIAVSGKIPTTIQKLVQAVRRKSKGN